MADTTDLNNIYYINFSPKSDTQTLEFGAQLDAVTESVNLNNQFLEIRANDAVQQKVDSKQLENAKLIKSNYKAKVVNHLASNAPWTSGFQIRTNNKSFRVERNKFHDELISHFTNGMNLPPSINVKLEGILHSIKEAIDDAAGDLLFFILMTTYQKDDVLQRWTPVFRTIHFRTNQSLVAYVKKKNDQSSGGGDMNVDVEIDYVQSDGSFNDKLFDNVAKESIQGIARREAQKIIHRTIDVPV